MGVNIEQPILQKITNGIGVTIDYMLGAGFWGKAYMLKNGNVLKITRDEEEYSKALEIKGKHIKHVVFIHDVYVLQRTNEKDLYAIIEDAVDTKCSEVFKLFEGDTDWNWTVRNYIFDDEDNTSVISSRKNETLKEYPHYKQFVEEYIELGYALKNAGFDYIDLAYGNIGYSHGVLTLFDVGISGKKTEQKGNIIVID